MPLFFVIAGFCWSCGDYVSYIRKKFTRLMIPYIVFNMIDMIPRQLLAQFVNRPRPIAESLVKILLYGGEFWFLYTLFVIFLIYPAIFRLAKFSRSRMLIIGGLLFLLAVYGLNAPALEIGSAAHYMFFFHAGVCIRYITGGRMPDVKFPAFMLTVMLGLWLALLFGTVKLEIITAIIGIIACFIMAKSGIFRRIFSRFSEYSLQLYLMNGIMLGISRTIICNILHVSSPAVIIAFNMLIDLLVSYMLIKYICRRSKIMRVMMGM